MWKKFCTIFCLLLFLLTTAVQAAPPEHPANFYQRYQLQKMLILSRHNLRSPLVGKNSFTAKLTPHSWFAWTSAPGELSLRGGLLETSLGQYFRKRLVRDGLLTETYIPKTGEIRFYANSFQRTIATAQYFSSGMLPVANVQIEHKLAVGKMDPVFNPVLHFYSEAFKAEASAQYQALEDGKGLNGIRKSLQPSFDLLEKVLDVQQGPASKAGSFTHFSTEASTPKLVLHKSPAFTGSLSAAVQPADALVLQYYEEPDKRRAAFGHRLTSRDWDTLARAVEVPGSTSFAPPCVAISVAQPLLQVMSDELALKSRKFTFLCGHDSNLMSVLPALQTTPYELPSSILKHAPIGSKLVIEKWVSQNGQEYAALSLVYQSTEQLRHGTMLSLENPPVCYPLKLNGLVQNADGLYLFSDVQQRFAQALAAYAALPRDPQPAGQTEKKLPEAA